MYKRQARDYRALLPNQWPGEATIEERMRSLPAPGPPPSFPVARHSEAPRRVPRAGDSNSRKGAPDWRACDLTDWSSLFIPDRRGPLCAGLWCRVGRRRGEDDACGGAGGPGVETQGSPRFPEELHQATEASVAPQVWRRPVGTLELFIISSSISRRIQDASFSEQE